MAVAIGSRCKFTSCELARRGVVNVSGGVYCLSRVGVVIAKFH